MELALREALRHGHNYIGTEQHRAGSAAPGRRVASQILADRGIAYEQLRTTVLHVLSHAA